VALCPDVVPFIDGRFNCRDLLQRSVIHYGLLEAAPHKRVTGMERVTGMARSVTVASSS